MTTTMMQVRADAGAAGTVDIKITRGPGYAGFDAPGWPAAIGAIRKRLAQALAHILSAGQMADLLECASELATNAVLHSRSGCPGGRFLVTVQLEAVTTAGPASVLVSVLDEGSRASQDRPATSRPGPEHGRGLMIVRALAEESGETEIFAGRLSWFRIIVSPAADRDAIETVSETLTETAAETPGRDVRALRDLVLAGRRS